MNIRLPCFSPTRRLTRSVLRCMRIKIDATAWQQYVSPYPSLVIDTGRERVLVDTGAGNLAPTTGQLLPDLRAAGIEPESIDIVVITHGHADHIGGIVTADGKLAFPRASYVMWSTEWDFWTSTPDLSALHIPDFIRQALLRVGGAQPAAAGRTGGATHRGR